MAYTVDDYVTSLRMSFDGDRFEIGWTYLDNALQGRQVYTEHNATLGAWPDSDTGIGGIDWNPTNFETLGRDTFTVRKSGSIIIYQNVRFEVVGSGNMPHGLATILAYKRSGNIIEQPLNVYDEISGAGSIYELTWLWIGELEASDIVQLIFTYPKSSTLNIGNAQIKQAYRAVVLDQSVIAEVSP